MFSLQTQLWISVLSFLVFGGLIMLYVRHEYLQRGALTQFGAFLQITAYGLQVVLTSFSIWGTLWPLWEDYIPDNWLGGFLLLLGILVCGIAIWNFRSMTRLTGRRSDQLVVKGLYKYSRNPQYIGYGLLILGFVISHWSATAWLAFASYLLLVGVTIRIEEEHLENLYGEAYRQYCRRVPRFIGSVSKLDDRGERDE